MYPPIRTLIYGRPYMDVHIWTPYKYIYERTYMGAHILTPIYGSDIYICRQKISKKFFVHIWFKLKGRIRPYMNHIRPYMDRDFLAWHVYGCPYMDMSVYGSIYGPLSLCDVPNARSHAFTCTHTYSPLDHSHSHTITLDTLTHTLILTLSLTHMHSHALPPSHVLPYSLSHSHWHALTRTPSLTHARTHTHMHLHALPH